MAIYDIVVPKDNMLRRISDLIRKMRWKDVNPLDLLINKTVIGDTAYSEKQNIIFAHDHNLQLVAR
jgi:hypothetical protein